MFGGQRFLWRLRSAFGQFSAALLHGQCFLCRRRSAFGRLLAALLRGQRFLCRCHSVFVRLSAVLLRGQRVLPAPLVSLVGQNHRSRCSCLSSLLLRERRARAAVLLVSQTCKSGLALLSPRSLAGKPDVEAVAAKPQEDSSGCRHVSCKSSAFGHKATSSLLVEKALMTCSLLIKKPLTTDGLLAFVGSMLVKESLAMIGLLALMSGFLVKMELAGCHLEAMVLILPQVVDCPLPIPVGVFRAGTSHM
jgi:hypothetical protein